MLENRNVGDDGSIDNLNQILFAQVRRLDIAKTDEDIKRESARTAALVKVATVLINAGKVALAAYDLSGGCQTDLPAIVKLPYKENSNRK